MPKVVSLLCLLSISLMANIASADIKLTKNDLVGTWKCVTEYKHDTGIERTTTLDKMNADGTMTQFWEVVYKHNYIGDDIELFNITNNWQLVGNRLKFTNVVIRDYQGFNEEKKPFNDDWQQSFKSQWQDKIQAYDYDIRAINKNYFETLTDEGNIVPNVSYCERMF